MAATPDPGLVALYWSGGSAVIPAGGRPSPRGILLFVWYHVGDTVQCHRVDLQSGRVEMAQSLSLGPFPLQLVPTGDTCMVLRFGAPTCQVLSTGDIMPMPHCPFVGTDHIIYSGRGEVLGCSPIGAAGTQWIWGHFGINYRLLTDSGMLTFFGVAAGATTIGRI
jgi:hypothetical protein